MPADESLVLLRPERTAFKFNGAGNLLHLWQIAYLRRDKIVGKPTHLPIDEASFYEPRGKVIADIVATVSRLMDTNGWSGRTGFSVCGAVKKFTDWVDSVGEGENLWRDSAQTGAQFLRFADKLRVAIAAGQKAQRTVSVLEATLLTFGREHFDETFCRKFKPIPQNKQGGTRPPDEAELQGFATALNEIFNVASEAVLQVSPFPICFRIDDEVPYWHLPNGKSRTTALAGPGATAWDIETGRLRERAEIRDIYAARGAKSPQPQALRAFNEARRILAEVNATPRHYERLSLATLASLSFGALFCLETGVNQSVMLQLETTEEFVEEVRRGKVTRAKYRGLKFRAGNREIAVSVSLGFMPKLMKYLAVRDYLLNEVEEVRLFIYQGADFRPVPFNVEWLKYLRKRLKRIGVAVPQLGTRKLRAAKQDHLIRHASPDVAAVLMGHSLSTAMRAYSNGSPAVHAEEMGGYLTKLEATVAGATVARNGIQIAIGNCGSFNKPAPAVINPPVQPSCKTTEGCLFCDKYQVHADEVDIRKLLSCRYVTRLVFSSTTTLVEHRASAVLTRIEVLLSELKNMSDLLYEKIQSEVEVNERLDPFWAAKLEQLALLGVV